MGKAGQSEEAAAQILSIANMYRDESGMSTRVLRASSFQLHILFHNLCKY